MYDQGDYNLLRENVRSTDWNECKNEDVTLYATSVTDKLISICNACIPTKTVCIRPSDPPWLNNAIRRKIRIRKRAFRKAKSTNRQNHWDKFRKLRNETVSFIRDAKRSYYEHLSTKLKSSSLSPRDWWNTLKHFISSKEKLPIPPLLCNGVTYFDDVEKSNILNDFFVKETLIIGDNTVVPHLPPFSGNRVLNAIHLTSSEVCDVLAVLPLGKAAGPDMINNVVLREAAKELSDPLCDLFNKSLDECRVPDTWKEANVCAIFKKGDPSLVQNYRPISLLNTLEKVFERLIFKYLYNHFHTNRLLTSVQSGFMPGDSTTNQLIDIYNTFCKALDEGKEVRVIFFDISKAFDRVWHRGLIAKLNSAGIDGKLLLWFTDYLQDRSQRVVLPGCKSDCKRIKSGVPQGSILGPLLFLLFINDIVCDIESHIKLFADDTSLFAVVDQPDRSALVLQSDMDKITHWSKKWLVTFNPAKTESLLISRKINKPVHPPLLMEGQQVSQVASHKHLGIFLSTDCTWNDHIQYI